VRVNCEAVRNNSEGVRTTGEAGRINPEGIRLCRVAAFSDSRIPGLSVLEVSFSSHETRGDLGE